MLVLTLVAILLHVYGMKTSGHMLVSMMVGYCSCTSVIIVERKMVL